MDLVVEEMASGVTHAALTGRLDIEGAQKIDIPLNALVGVRRRMVMDLGGVTFMASMGLRTLMVAARALSANGGKLVLANPQPNVAKVLAESGIGDLIGTYPSLDDAVAAALSA